MDVGHRYFLDKDVFTRASVGRSSFSGGIDRACGHAVSNCSDVCQIFVHIAHLLCDVDAQHGVSHGRN